MCCDPEREGRGGEEMGGNEGREEIGREGRRQGKEDKGIIIEGWKKTGP